jgi:hypothetical protein
MSQISKATQSSESDTDIIQDIPINSVVVASIRSENETPAKPKRGLNEIYRKYKKYDTYKEATVEINGFGTVNRRPANDQHEYACVQYVSELT